MKFLWVRFGMAAFFTTCSSLAQVASAQSKTQCTCPSVRADAFGSSSCSANESANRCRIEYNQFAAAEMDGVLKVFKQAGIELRAMPRESGQLTLETSRMISAMDQDVRAQTIVAYMSVAAARGDSFTPSNARELYGAVIGNKYRMRAVAEAFGSGAYSDWQKLVRDDKITKPQGIYRDGDFVSSVGCASVRVAGAWYMYKANWSPARNSPQCE